MLAFSVYAQEQKLLVVSNIEELISVKAKENFWQKDQDTMGMIGDLIILIDGMKLLFIHWLTITQWYMLYGLVWMGR